MQLRLRKQVYGIADADTYDKHKIEHSMPIIVSAQADPSNLQVLIYMIRPRSIYSGSKSYCHV